MKILLIIAIIISGFEILCDLYRIATKGESDLLIHIFYEVVFALSLANI